jgi:ankyrin repeat protein
LAAFVFLAAAPVAGASEALLAAALRGDAAEVRALAQDGVDLNYTQSASGQSALLLAAQRGHLGVVQALLARGAAVNVPRADGQTPLHLAAANGYLEIATALVEAEADFDLQANPGWTPLMLASAKGHKAIVDMLGPQARRSIAKPTSAKRRSSWRRQTGMRTLPRRCSQQAPT